MRNGVIAAGLVALGLLVAACGESGKATPESKGGGERYVQPSGVPSMSVPAVPPSAGPSESPSAMPSESGSAMPSAGPVRVNAKKTDLGMILVDGKGRTLYLFEKDKGHKGVSTCVDACMKAWPPFVTSGTPVAGTGVKAEWLKTTTRPDGTMQVTYHDWPLYYFGEDKKPGDMKGQDVTAFGAPWYVVGADKGEKAEK